MVSKRDREFDFIVFGATGYTGRYVIEELAHTSLSNNIKWAIAGRNVKKLKESLTIVQGYLGETIDIQGVPIIEADVQDAASLSNMCKRADLILNCAGPYNLFGEPVIKACVDNETHHVDMSGEMKYLETVQAKYFETARAKNIYIVGACGFDSIPGDYGIALLKENFIGDLNSVEYYITIGIGPSGMTRNSGTFLSAALGFREILNQKYYDKLLKESGVFKKELPESSHPLSWRLPPYFYSSVMKSWCLWFLGADDRVIKRSQKFAYEYLNERPVQQHGYIGTCSFLTGLCYLIFGSMFGFMAMFSWGRYLLTKYPSFFSGGTFTHEGPTREQVLEGSVKVTLCGEGWKEKLLNPTDKHTTKPDCKFKLTISGPDPFYPFTAICMVQCGMTILQESHKMPLEGGVLSPGVAFAKTSLQKRLKDRGVSIIFDLTPSS